MTRGAALLAALHVFVVPRDPWVQDRLATDQPKLAELHAQILQSEPELAAAKESLDAARKSHEERS